MRGGIVTLLVIMLTSALFAQDNYEDFVIQESKRAKNGGISMMASGLLLTAGGVATLLNDSASVPMGAALLTAGVALDVGSVIMFIRSKRIIDDARNEVKPPVSFYIKPDGAQFVYNF